MKRLTAIIASIVMTSCLPAFADLPGSMTAFSAPSVGLNVAYPSSWEIKANSDKDTLIMIAPKSGSNLHADCAIAVMQTVDDEKLAMGLIEQMIRSHSPKYQVTAKGDLFIGPKNKLKAYSQTFALESDQVKLLHKDVVVRAPNGSTVVFSFSYTPSQSGSAEPVFQSILSSVQFGAKASTSKASSPASLAKSADATTLISYTSKSPSITISYPSGWKLATNVEADTIAKFNGGDDKGRGGELTVSSMPAPRSNLEDLEPMLDEHIFQKLKNYHTVRKESMSFGSPRSFAGQMVEGTSDADGHEARHLTCYCKEQDHYFVVSLWGVGYKPGELHTLFSKIANTFRIND